MDNEYDEQRHRYTHTLSVCIRVVLVVVVVVVVVLFGCCWFLRSCVTSPQHHIESAHTSDEIEEF